jgi:hypothetical protein
MIIKPKPHLEQSMQEEQHVKHGEVSGTSIAIIRRSDLHRKHAGHEALTRRYSGLV